MTTRHGFEESRASIMLGYILCVLMAVVAALAVWGLSWLAW